MIHFDMQFKVLKVNAANEHGDTPLHLASRWGYGKTRLISRIPVIKTRADCTSRHGGSFEPFAGFPSL